MPRYLVVSKRAGDDAFTKLLEEEFPGAHRSVVDNAWIVYTTKTSKEVSNTLFPENNPGSRPTNFVVSFGGFYGYLDRDVWEWMDIQDGDE